MILGLGTAQFGMNYGISNSTGQVKKNEVENIIKYAKNNGVSIIDSAYSYGDSENVLGAALFSEDKFKIISKTAVIDAKYISDENIKNIDIAFRRTLQKLQKKSIYALLVHNCDNLFIPGHKLLVKLLKSYIDTGLVEKIGVSVYSPKEYLAVSKVFNPDVVQIPLNVLDQRFFQTGLLEKLCNDGIEIHARSVFLQGLLLMDPLDRLKNFKEYSSTFNSFDKFCNQHGLKRIEACLGFVKQMLEIKSIIVGVTTKIELQEQFEAISKLVPDLDSYQCLASNEKALIDPREWK